jgi:hypothetical protein
MADADELWAAGPATHDGAWFAERRGAFQRFRSRPAEAGKAHICVVVSDEASRALPPSLVDELEAAVAAGSVARMILTGPDRHVSTVDGVWRHVIPPAAAGEADTIGDELDRIHAGRVITEIVLVGGPEPRLPPGVPVRRTAAAP